MIPIRHKDLDLFAQRHFEAIRNRFGKVENFTLIDYQNIDDWFKRISKNKYTFENIIKVKPAELEELKDYFIADKYPDEILKLKNLYEDFAKSNSNFGERKNKYNAYFLVEKLGIKVCPYCNRNYIHNINHKTRKRTSELDHFYNKDEFPFLAVSFYNLVPSCKVCNKLKLQKSASINPYDTRYWNRNLLKFNLKIKSVNFYLDKESIEINAQALEEKMKDNFNAFELAKLYENHTDIALDLIQKSITYNDSYIDELFQTYEGTLFRNREDVLLSLKHDTSKLKSDTLCWYRVFLSYS
ncbi:MAG: hypothetical protein MUE81_10430 [Thermoflexibacter sp.]|nr:hypothetical protein [Thermoflexibacter sp.]